MDVATDNEASGYSSGSDPEAISDRSSPGPAPADEAPVYPIPDRQLGAVEVPAVVQNVDRAIKAFGRVQSLEHTLESERKSIPLYLVPEDPFCKPLMSHNAVSHNVVLKVTVPKRTGRKRKRGSKGPWQGDVEIADAELSHSGAAAVSSVARLDDPKILKRKLADSAEDYEVEAVGMIKHTHRFRGLADFAWDMSKSSFAERYTDQALSGDVSKLKDFDFIPGTDFGPNVDIIPPPIFTHQSLPFNYNFSQNPYVRTTEDGGTVNLTAVKQVGYFIGADEPAPTEPQSQPDMTNPRTVECIAQLEEAFRDRPVWTRRALLNHLGGVLKSWNELKKYLNYTAYQFKGGPWRDGVVPYGIDPRTDPKYRIYQTVMFKLPKQKVAESGQSWHSLRRAQTGPAKEFLEELSQSHLFDGETYHSDGKVWQVCDIVDPLLKEVLENAAVRQRCDISVSGWYHGGLWAKVKAIMKTKLLAIRFGRQLTRRDFAATLQAGDQTPVRNGSTAYQMPLPNLHLTEAELTQLKGRPPQTRKQKSFSVRVKDPSRTRPREVEAGSSVGVPDESVAPQEESENEESGSGSDMIEDETTFQTYNQDEGYDQDAEEDMEEDEHQANQSMYPELE